MATFLEAADGPAVVGFDASWRIELRRAGPDGRPLDVGVISFGRNDYDAQIAVHRSSGFTAATFDVSIEGLSDDDHAKIVGLEYVFVKIELGWRDLDTGFGAPITDAVSMLTGGAGGTLHEVVHGRLTSYERRHGEFRYVTHLAGVDEQFHRLRSRRATQPDLQDGSSAEDYVRALCEQVDVGFRPHPATGPYESVDGRITIRDGLTVAQAIDHVAERAHAGGEGRRIPTYVGLDGLHFGPWAARVSAGEEQRLEAATGLVEARPSVQSDAGASDAASDPLAPPTPGSPFAVRSSLTFDVILRGRSDLTIGSTVGLVIDEPAPGQGAGDTTVADSVLGGLGDVAAGIAGAFGPPVELDFTTCRVIDVKHELNRSKGFVTTITVESQETIAAEPTEPASRPAERSSDEAERTAELMRRAARDRAEVAGLDVGLVRAQSTRPQTAGGNAFEAQRVEVDAGLQRDHRRNAAVTADPAETPTRLPNKAVLTPFAFGRTGLVVPHYPGTRVATMNYRDDVSHAFVAGCLWHEDAAPTSQPGDYWLSLPTDVATTERTDDPRGLEVDPELDQSVHDLVDASGGRAIHVTGFRISVGGTHTLPVGERPDNALVDEILIEHTSGARIRIDDSGNIEINTPEDLTLTANKITMNVSDKVEVVK